jgi:hypothetical protein
VLGPVRQRDPDRALIALLYRSGLRVSEIVALKPADVDLRKHSARVLHGKGDKATTRGFHPSCDDALARWIDTRKALGIRGGTLFCTLQGGAGSNQYVRNALHHLGRQGPPRRMTGSVRPALSSPHSRSLPHLPPYAAAVKRPGPESRAAAGFKQAKGRCGGNDNDRLRTRGSGPYAITFVYTSVHWCTIGV